MIDPTYSQRRIDENPIWELAFAMSEMVNDNAPIGWGEYIILAGMMLNTFDIKRKEGTTKWLI